MAPGPGSGSEATAARSSRWRRARTALSGPSGGAGCVSLAGDRRPASVTLPEHGVAAFRRAGGGLWLAVEGTISSFVDNRLTTLDVRPPVAQRVTASCPRKMAALWVAAGNEVSRLELQPNGTWRRRALPLGLEPQAASPCAERRRAGQPLDRDRRARAVPRQSPSDAPSGRRGRGGAGGRAGAGRPRWRLRRQRLSRLLPRECRRRRSPGGAPRSSGDRVPAGQRGAASLWRAGRPARCGFATGRASSA